MNRKKDDETRDEQNQSRASDTSYLFPVHLGPRQGFGLAGRAVEVRFGFDILEASAHALFGVTLGDGQAPPKVGQATGGDGLGSVCGEPAHRRNPSPVIGE